MTAFTTTSIKINLSKFLIIAGILAVIALPCRAGLGESEDDCAKRYGKPVSFPPPGASDFLCPRKVQYTQNGYTIVIGFIENQASMFTVTKLDNTFITDKEMTSFMDEDSKGHQWKKSNEASHDESWDRDDGAHAEFNSDTQVFTIIGKNYVDLLAAQKKADDKGVDKNAPPPPM